LCHYGTAKSQWQAKTEKRNLIRLQQDCWQNLTLWEKLIGDETWVFQYKPETKCQSAMEKSSV
jgi:hypothetical protein